MMNTRLNYFDIRVDRWTMMKVFLTQQREG
jgi:hypothetical protein